MLNGRFLSETAPPITEAEFPVNVERRGPSMSMVNPAAYTLVSLWLPPVASVRSCSTMMRRGESTDADVPPSLSCFTLQDSGVAEY